jgi:hypothetical protein
MSGLGFRVWRGIPGGGARPRNLPARLHIIIIVIIIIIIISVSEYQTEERV